MSRAAWLRDLWQSGELHRVASQCRSQAELARKLGRTPDAFTNARRRLNADGVGIPSFDELRFPKLGTAVPDLGTAADASVHAPPVAVDSTEPSTKWPNLAAFDAEPVPLDPLPAGHVVKGVSSLVGPDGEIKQQWIKTSAQNDERQDWLDAIRNMAPDLPRLEPIVPVEPCNDDLLAVYPVGDPHVGLLAWHRDAGENFDMAIAERNLVTAFQHLIGVAPPASEALLIFIGDNTHVDGQHNTTTAGTRQDADGRTIKMADTILTICRRAVSLALQKHQRVRLVIERGNHDELISAMLTLALNLHYENEPRVAVDTSPEMYHWHRFGLNLIGTHHGDKAKSSALLGVMACDRAEDWGQTKHRRWYAGHYHHLMTKEEPGMVVDYLPTLAGSDAWHRAMGYRSGRAMYMDVLHREWGHVDRHIIGISQIKARAA